MSEITNSVQIPRRFGSMPAFLGGMAILLVISLSVAISVGAVPFPLGTGRCVIAYKVVAGLIEHTWSQSQEAIVWEIRFPRASQAMRVGANLKTVKRNPLADPQFLGTLSG